MKRQFKHITIWIWRQSLEKLSLLNDAGCCQCCRRCRCCCCNSFFFQFVLWIKFFLLMCLFYSLCRSRHIALNTCFFYRLSGTRKNSTRRQHNINRKFFESNVRHIKLLSKNEMTKIRLKYKWEPMQHSRAWITVHSGWSTREQATEPMARWLRIVGEQVQNILLQILLNILNCCKNFECMIWQLRQRAWGIWTWRIYLSSTS